MSDLETRIRDALRADEIGWDDLRQPTLRPRPRSRRRWPAALATAAAVAVVATVAATIAHDSGSNGPAAHPPYAGYTWRLTGLTDSRGPVATLASVPARISFSDTAVIGTVDDASISGHYRATAHGYHLTDIGVAGASTSIHGHNEMRIGDAFGRLFLNDDTTLKPANLATVTVRVSGEHLVLQANRVTARLSRVGPSQLSPMIDAVGYTWHVQAVTDAQGRLTIPRRSHGSIGFARYGLVLARDTTNTLEARFGLTGHGYVVGHRLSSTARGHVGQDPTARRLEAAVDTMVDSDAPVSATVDGDTLTLRRHGITLSLRRGAPMPDSLIVSGSGGASRPTAAASQVLSAVPSAGASPQSSAATPPRPAPHPRH